MEKENELILGTEDKKQIFLDDIFHINTEKPVPLSQKIKSKLFKWSKPFGLGIAAYLIYELLKRVGSILMDWGQAAYQFCVDIIDKINIYLLTTPSPVAPPVTTESPNPATISDLTNTMAGQMGAMGDLLSAMAYLAGMGMGINAALKLKEHGENPDRVSISQPLTLMMVSAMLLALPSFFAVSTSGTFGTGTANTAMVQSDNVAVVSTPQVEVPTITEAK